MLKHSYLFLFTIFISCQSKIERQIIGIWQVEKIEYSPDHINYEEQPLGCNEQDSWIFYKDGTFKIVSGLVLCGDGNPETGTWWLSDDEIILYTTIDGYIGTLTDYIVLLTRKKLILEHEWSTGSNEWIRYYFSSL